MKAPLETRPFDPYAILKELERERVAYVVVGALARVIQGADEITDGIDLTPSPREQNLERLERALGRLGAKRTDGRPLGLTGMVAGDHPVVVLETGAGEMKLVLQPAGTRGYDDIRRRADRLHLGQGLRPQVAAPEDLVRMLEALGRETDRPHLEAMRRVVELERDFGVSM